MLLVGLVVVLLSGAVFVGVTVVRESRERSREWRDR